jgi:hypothetical protein
MGSVDTLEIQKALPSPPRLVLFSHRRRMEIAVPVDEACVASVAALLQEPDASFWLRSVSHTLVQVFLFWRRSTDFVLIVRVKRGTARREVRIPCTKEPGRALLAVSREEWSDAA